MRIDLRKLYAKGSLSVNEMVTVPDDYYKQMGVRKMDAVLVDGKIIVNYDNNIELDLMLKGKFIMPCAITMEDVDVPFETKIEEEILENTLKNDFYLDLLDILWENIVLEIPLRVVKEGAVIEHLHGEGWEVTEE